MWGSNRLETAPKSTQHDKRDETGLDKLPLGKTMVRTSFWTVSMGKYAMADNKQVVQDSTKAKKIWFLGDLKANNNIHNWNK